MAGEGARLLSVHKKLHLAHPAQAGEGVHKPIHHKPLLALVQGLYQFARRTGEVDQQRVILPGDAQPVRVPEAGWQDRGEARGGVGILGAGQELV